MKRMLIALYLGAALLLSGCGGIYANYRETEELSVIQTLGADIAPGGVRLSVAADEETKLTAEAPDLSAARDKLQDLSPSEDIFFAHSAYALLGEALAREGVAPVLDHIARSTLFRLDMPLFVLLGEDASELVLRAEDVTKLLRSVERNLEKRGSCYVFSAGEIMADLNASGSALICAVKSVAAADSDPDAEKGELAVEPAGYAIIKNGRLIGTLDPEAALGAQLLLNRAGPVVVELGDSAVQLDKAACELTPTIENGRLTELAVTLTVSAALCEGGTENEELSAKLAQCVSSALDKGIALDCDPLQLCDALRCQRPIAYRKLTIDMNSLRYTVAVSSAITRSFDLEKTEDSP